MGRLIDADVITDFMLEHNTPDSLFASVEEIVAYQPTAFNVEAVVEEIHEYFGKIMDERIVERDNVPIGEINDILKYNKAVAGIVRKGGVK